MALYNYPAACVDARLTHLGKSPRYWKISEDTVDPSQPKKNSGKSGLIACLLSSPVGLTLFRMLHSECKTARDCLRVRVEISEPTIIPMGANIKLMSPAEVGEIEGIARQTIGGMALPAKAQ